MKMAVYIIAVQSLKGYWTEVELKSGLGTSVANTVPLLNSVPFLKTSTRPG